MDNDDGTSRCARPATWRTALVRLLTGLLRRVFPETARLDDNCRGVLEISSDPLVVVEDGRVVASNGLADALFGHEGKGLVGRPIAELLPDARSGGLVLPVCGPTPVPGRHRNGSMLALEASTRPAPVAGQALLLLRDARERPRAEPGMLEDEGRDPLTGLADRVRLSGHLAGLIALEGSGAPFAVLLLDLDGFRAVNDSEGHHGGDSLLAQVGARLAAMMPPGALLARPGGDEFAAVVPELFNVEDAIDIGWSMIRALDQPFDLDGRRIFSSASVGVAVYPDDAGTASSLLSRADSALYRAKAEGRGLARRYDPALATDASDTLELQSLLREALQAGDQLQLYFQPQLNLPERKVSGFEALLRWTHPVRGPIEPSRFIAAAEAGGLIVPIGDWVLDQACRHARLLQQAGHPFRVAVNLSTQQLRLGDLVERVEAALRRHALPPSALELELTESSVMSDPAMASATLERLSRLGVQIAIDDFGTGYASLTYLRTLPLHKLKIDRSFVLDLEVGGRGRAIVQGLIRIAHSLGLTVLAEGVEAAAQRQILCNFGCDEFQGWLVSPALPAGALPEFLARYRPEHELAGDALACRALSRDFALGLPGAASNDPTRRNAEGCLHCIDVCGDLRPCPYATRLAGGG